MSPLTQFSGLVAASSPQQQNLPPSGSRRLNALLVFDDRDRASRCVLELNGAGFEVAADYATARYEFEVRLRGGAYDVIVAGEVLRGWTVLDLLAASKEIRRDIPVIVVGDS